MTIQAPFPWFGGKSRAAAQIWTALGDVDNYVEPFAGSLGAMLARPHAPRIETVNDADGMLVNWWRAVRAVPDEVAEHADWPVSETDLLARHLWLVERRAEITRRLHADPDWYDAKAAGWWVWGAASWIGSGWCSGGGPWRVEEGEVRKLPHLGNARGGVHRQLPHLGDYGRNIHRPTVDVKAWFGDLATRLARVRIACGDWERITTPVVCERNPATSRGFTGLLLDPPYPEGWDTRTAYAGQDGDAADVCARVFEVAQDLATRGCRVVVCGYSGVWAAPEGWTERRWIARKGYAKSTQHHREVLWCSPACLPERELTLFGGAS